MAGVLTQNLVLQKTKLDNMKHVRKLNVCGVHCNDIGVLREARNVEVLSLSVNDIAELDALSDLSQLKELYLRKNCIRDIYQVLHLARLPMLACLNLSENPVSADPQYRPFVVAALQNLSRLDDIDIDRLEREDAIRLFPDAHRQSPPSPASSVPFGSPSRPSTTPRGGSAPPQKQFQSSNTRASAALTQRFEELTSTFDEMPVGGRRNQPQGGNKLRRSPQEPQHAAAAVVQRPSSLAAGPREEGVVVAVKTLLNELSPAALMEIRQYIDSIRN
jgi:hypothetical protein